MAELCFVKIPSTPMSKVEIRENDNLVGQSQPLDCSTGTVNVNGIIQDPINSADWHAAATSNKMLARQGQSMRQDRIKT